MKTRWHSVGKNQKARFHRRNILLVLAISTIALFASCTRDKSHKIENVECAFYYWQSNSSLSERERKMCVDVGVKKLYIKFFEVNFSGQWGNFPDAKIASWHQSVMGGFNEVVPTVYLRNVVFKESSQEDLDILADNINYLINKYCEERFWVPPTVNEFQMDCDWTITTKDNYFYFLKKLKSISKKQISCTLRLYPYKYPDKMGVPPVDKAMLMCYNLLSPLEDPNRNSILDLPELKSYLTVREKYLLHLDIALPIYSWIQIFHDERFSGVSYIDTRQLKDILKQERPLWYSVTKDTVIDETYFRVGDKIKLEEIDAEKIKNAIVLLKEHIHFDKNTTFALFHLDEKPLNKFTHEELSSFYTDFSQ